MESVIWFATGRRNECHKAILHIARSRRIIRGAHVQRGTRASTYPTPREAFLTRRSEPGKRSAATDHSTFHSAVSPFSTTRNEVSPKRSKP